jgi:hypothetical protein
MRRLVLLVATMALTTGVLAPVASAQPRGSAIVEADKGTFGYDFTESELCDFDVQVVGSGQFSYRIREGRGPDQQAYFLHNTFSFTETLRAGDRYVTVSARTTLNEVRAVPLGDGLFQFLDIFAGRLAVRNADGRLLGHEAGAIRSTYTFDTLNDDQPGGVVVGEIEDTLHGRFDDLDAVICAALAPADPR